MKQITVSRNYTLTFIGESEKRKHWNLTIVGLCRKLYMHIVILILLFVPNLFIYTEFDAIYHVAHWRHILAESAETDDNHNLR